MAINNQNILNLIANAFNGTNKRPMKKLEFTNAVNIAYEIGQLASLESLYHHMKQKQEDFQEVDDVIASLHLVMVGQHNHVAKMGNDKTRISLDHFIDLELEYQKGGQNEKR